MWAAHEGAGSDPPAVWRGSGTSTTTKPPSCSPIFCVNSPRRAGSTPPVGNGETSAPAPAHAQGPHLEVSTVPPVTLWRTADGAAGDFSSFRAKLFARSLNVRKQIFSAIFGKERFLGRYLDQQHVCRLAWARVPLVAPGWCVVRSWCSWEGCASVTRPIATPPQRSDTAARSTAAPKGRHR